MRDCTLNETAICQERNNERDLGFNSRLVTTFFQLGQSCNTKVTRVCVSFYMFVHSSHLALIGFVVFVVNEVGGGGSGS